MKVFAFIGSPRGNESMGYRFVKLIEKELKKIDESSSMIIRRADEVDINDTDGSVMDFVVGQTRYQDDMVTIEKELLESDIIIFVSPVYAHNISSHMKRFIDRLSYWLHIYRLIGKKGYVVSTSSNNGNDMVNDYLTSMMQYLGLYVIGKMSLQSEKIENQSILESFARMAAKNISLGYKTQELDIPYTQAQNFIHFQNEYCSLKNESNEKTYWKEHGYFDVKTFEELYRREMVN